MGALILLGLVLRVALVLGSPHFVPKTDAADYDQIAVSLAQHGRFPASVITHGPSAFRPPLFPGALAAVYKVVGVGSASTRWEAGRLLETALGALTIALIGLITLRLAGRRASLVAAGIAAVYPPLVLVDSSLMSESLFIPLVLAAALAGLVARDSPHGWRWAAGSGVLIALGALTRGNGIALVIPLAFLVWTGRPRLSRRALVAPLAMLAAAALTLAPWTLRNAREFHEFVPITTETGYATAGTFNSFAAHRKDFPALWAPPVTEALQVVAKHPSLNEAQLSDRLNTLALDYEKAHPAYLLKVFWWNGLRLLNLSGVRFEKWAAKYEAYPPWLAIVSVYAFWLLGLLALAALATGAARRAPPALWWFPVLIFLTTVFFLGSTRYRSPADPFLIVLVALAVPRGGSSRRPADGGRSEPKMRLPSAAA